MLSNNVVEFYFRNAKEIKLLVADERGGKTMEKVGGRSGLSNPTEVEAIKNMTPIAFVDVEDKETLEYLRIYKPEKVVETIHIIKKELTGNHKKILKMKYEKKMMRKEICEQLEISFKKYNATLNELMAFAKGAFAVALE